MKATAKLKMVNRPVELPMMTSQGIKREMRDNYVLQQWFENEWGEGEWRDVTKKVRVGTEHA